jgi:hypothetical protein
VSATSVAGIRAATWQSCRAVQMMTFSGVRVADGVPVPTGRQRRGLAAQMFRKRVRAVYNPAGLTKALH